MSFNVSPAAGNRASSSGKNRKRCSQSISSTGSLVGQGKRKHNFQKQVSGTVVVDNYAVMQTDNAAVPITNVLQHLEGRKKVTPSSTTYIPALVRSRAMETFMKKKRKSKRNVVGLDLK